VRGYTRGYINYLFRQRELTGLRLLTRHNLYFIARLMEDLRLALAAGKFGEVAASLRGGATPGYQDL
jgi:queuine tRNA-ribosyltransferase